MKSLLERLNESGAVTEAGLVDFDKYKETNLTVVKQNGIQYNVYSLMTAGGLRYFVYHHDRMFPVSKNEVNGELGAVLGSTIDKNMFSELFRKGVKDFSGFVWEGDTFDCDGMGVILGLPALPNCKSLYCSGNKIAYLPELPKCVLVNCSHNQLTTIPKLPNCENLDCTGNRIVTIGELPKCRILMCGLNQRLKTLPKMPHLETIDYTKTGIAQGKHNQGAHVEDISVFN